MLVPCMYCCKVYCFHGSSGLVRAIILCVCVVFLSVLAVLTVLMFYLDAGLLASSQCPEGPVMGHLGTGFSWFPCV
jgi:hypothetical protein